MIFLPELVAFAVVVLCGLAEWRHSLRIRKVVGLTFGPERKGSAWLTLSHILRPLALGLLAWSLITLYQVQPKVHKAKVLGEDEYRHLILVLDVSPSMRLEDSGLAGQQTRMQRASEVMESFFKRIVMAQMRFSVIATYTGAKPVVVDTRDPAVLRNILNDLPMHHAFEAGKTQIFSGLEEAAKIAEDWDRDSATIILVSDGDTVPAKGMPKMPPSVSDVLVIGVGNPTKGTFIDGKNSKQDASTLRQIALRLGGTYHDGNLKHLSSDLVEKITLIETESAVDKLGKREIALAGIVLSVLILVWLPWALRLLGTSWRPGRAV